MPQRTLILSITVIFFSFFILVIIGIFIANSSSEIHSTPITEIDKPVGVWGPFSNSGNNLEQLWGNNQSEAISDIIMQGFDEYYFVMSNFENPKQFDSTESLLQSAENLDHVLKIIIIVLPPSEGGPDGNYDWEGWIEYFNSLKERYPNSFEGFTIDDFNWISTRNDTRFEYNIDFMEHSNLIDALQHKREDVKFYPTVYFEGERTDVFTNEYLKYVDGIIAVSGCYYNVSVLEPQLHLFGELFDNKPMKYVVYPTITHNYTRQSYSPPSDQLVISTLYIASRMVDGIIIWHAIDSPVIQEYLKNIDNSESYIFKMNRIKDVQIEEELTAWDAANEIHANSTEAERNCLEWYEKYLRAYNYWVGLNSDQKVDDSLKEKLLSFIN
ncbi:MAG TPA: hypothetical protein VH797_07355 [Nitrososphaeraceae archaeon]|jgi:hypothetical protein